MKCGALLGFFEKLQARASLETRVCDYKRIFFGNEILSSMKRLSFTLKPDSQGRSGIF